MFKGIDFYSDTVTRPTAGMRRAIAEAEVGDEQKAEDPTTRRLEEMAARLLGMDCAMFFPSATMSNQVALKLLTEPGDEIFAYEHCHLFNAEAGGPAIHSSLMARPIRTSTGIFSGDDVREAYRGNKGPHYPVSRLVAVENTTNVAGGYAWSENELSSVVKAAKDLGLSLHMDGARFFHAVVKTGMSPAQVANGFDTVTLCLSKGLGCPVGALLVYRDKTRWAKLRRLKQLMGGALRQSGILAAAGIYALEHHIKRMAEDHQNAKHFAQGLKGIRYIEVENENPSTNMVFFKWNHPKVTDMEFLKACTDRGIRFSRMDANRFRAVCHLDISSDQVNQGLAILRGICSEF